jgi:hypothetical protein
MSEDNPDLPSNRNDRRNTGTTTSGATGDGKGAQGKENPLRFGAEFGPTSVSGTTQGVSLGTFKQLVWLSNVGGLILFVIGLELLLVQGMPIWGIVLLLAGTIIALFPSNFEIVGMGSPEVKREESKDE